MSKKWRPDTKSYELFIDADLDEFVGDQAFFISGFAKHWKFRTRAEAEMALRKIKAILKSGEIK